MENETFERFNREMRSFFALIILNIVGAGLGMAFGVAWCVGNVQPLFAGQPVQILNVAMAGLALAGCAVAISWLTKSAEVFDGFDDLKDEVGKEDVKAGGDALTGLIVRSIAWYREKQENIGQLKFGSRITGAFFLLSAALQAINLVSTLGSATQTSILLSVLGLALCLVLGALGLMIPSAVTRFTGTWDRRVEASGEAEKKLGELLEGS